MKPMTQDLPVKLNDKEMRERAHELGSKIAEHAELEIEKKHTADSFKNKIEDVETRIAGLGRITKNGEEYRPVEVITRKDFERSIVETIRLDTAVIVDSRPMTISEKQAGLFDKKESTKDEIAAFEKKVKDEGVRVTFTAKDPEGDAFATKVKRLTEQAEKEAKAAKKARGKPAKADPSPEI